MIHKTLRRLRGAAVDDLELIKFFLANGIDITEPNGIENERVFDTHRTRDPKRARLFSNLQRNFEGARQYYHTRSRRYSGMFDDFVDETITLVTPKRTVKLTCLHVYANSGYRSYPEQFHLNVTPKEEPEWRQER